MESLLYIFHSLLLSLRSIHARAEGTARGKKAEMVVQCTKANAKQCTEDSFQVEV